MAAPPRKPFKDLPVLSFTDFDSVGLVKNTLRELEVGRFYVAAQLVDMMTRDDRIAAKLEDRIGALLGKPLEFNPSGHAQRSGGVVKKLEASWPKMAPNSSLAELMKWALMLGFAPATNEWDRADEWIPRLKVWNPRHAYYRWDVRSFWMSTQDGIVEIQPGDGQWVVHAPFGLERGWMGGLVRRLAVPWLIRQWAFRDWARYSEVHGLPLRKAIVPQNASAESKKKFLMNVVEIANETAIETPQSADAKFDVELVEAAANTWEGFEKLLSKCETAIDIAILGQNLTTEVKQGSRAAANVHQGVKQEYVRSDAIALTCTAREQILQPWARFNFGDEELAPEPMYRVDPPEDEGERATTMTALGQGIQALRTAGLKPDVDALADEYGIPTTGPAEEPEPQSAPGEEPPDDDEQPAAGDQPDEEQEEEQLAASRIALARNKLKGTVRGQLFADALADSSRAHAKRVVKPDLEELLKLVKKADSYSALRESLVKAFGSMDPARLADLMEKSMVLAQLAGRHAVLEDL